MSLTGKDLIATFNWDPLLVQAIRRCFKYTRNLPQVAFLHGNVAVGFCEKDSVMGNLGAPCVKCGERLQSIPLLYPVREKNYNNNIAIQKSWKELMNALDKAYMITIFGYSAPKSDVEAISLMKHAWGKAAERDLEEIEIINHNEEDKIIPSWRDFIFESHYSYHKEFFSCSLARYPRRSCEAMFDRLMNCEWLDDTRGFREDMSFEDINKLTKGLIKEECLKRNQSGFLSDPYLS